MKRHIFLLISVVLFLAGCSKESIPGSEGAVKVCVTAQVQDATDPLTKASWDKDGNGSNVDHWVVEVRDILDIETVYYHAEKPGDEGVLEQTFELYLIPGHTYDIAFWADKAGCYATEDLTAVECKDVTKIGNSDDFDGFFRCVRYAVDGDAKLSARLYRPFSQVNVVTTDLPKLKSSTTPEAYALYEPVDYSFKLTVPTVLNAFTGETSGEEEITITPEDDVNHCYGDYDSASEITTIYMVYVLTSKSVSIWDKDVRDIDFAFNTGDVELVYDFKNIPLKRNYRTNIIGSFMTNTLKWTVEVIPNWLGEIPSFYF